MNYNGLETANITSGYYDNITGTLTLFDNAGPGNAGYDPVGQECQWNLHRLCWFRLLIQYELFWTVLSGNTTLHISRNCQ